MAAQQPSPIGQAAQHRQPQACMRPWCWVQAHRTGSSPRRQPFWQAVRPPPHPHPHPHHVQRGRPFMWARLQRQGPPACRQHQQRQRPQRAAVWVGSPSAAALMMAMMLLHACPCVLVLMGTCMRTCAPCQAKCKRPLLRQTPTLPHYTWRWRQQRGGGRMRMRRRPQQRPQQRAHAAAAAAAAEALRMIRCCAQQQQQQQVTAVHVVAAAAPCAWRRQRVGAHPHAHAQHTMRRSRRTRPPSSVEHAPQTPACPTWSCCAAGTSSACQTA